MANRIYIYTANRFPTKITDSLAVIGAKGLYEVSWSQTLISNILTGTKFLKETYSPIWEDENASSAISEFLPAIQLYTDLLPAIVAMIPEHKEFLSRLFDSKTIVDTAHIISSQRGRYIITDFSEISQMETSKPENIRKLNTRDLKDSINVANEIKKIVSAKEKKRPKLLYEYLKKTGFRSYDDIGFEGFATELYYGSRSKVSNKLVEEFKGVIHEKTNFSTKKKLVERFEIGPSEIHGNGVISKGNYNPGELIGVAIYPARNGMATTEFGAHLNHTKDPNAETKFEDGCYKTYAIKMIYPHDEIAVDYTVNKELEQPEDWWDKEQKND
jgi:ArsR family metal-binding transcriptional regulator